MKKITLLLGLIFMCHSIFAQKYYTKKGHISFFSTTSVEDIQADNYQSSSIINFESGDIVFSLLIKGFEFEKALMQEHFNEKYLESDEFPKAKYAGKIENFESINLSKDGTYDLDVNGTMYIHGSQQEVNAKFVVTIKNGILSGESKFVLVPEEYNIKIPGVVKDRIAKEVTVSVKMEYQEYIK